MSTRTVTAATITTGMMRGRTPTSTEAALTTMPTTATTATIITTTITITTTGTVTARA